MFKGTMADMNWRDVQNLADENAVVLLPIGVIEEHGPHLCLGTDIYTACIYCRYIKQMLESAGIKSAIAPPFYWGVCQSTGDFTGSFRVRKETAKALLYDIIASLAEFGFKRVVGVNAHGDVKHNVAIIEAFRDAGKDFSVSARYAMGEERIPHFGLTGSEPFLCPVKERMVYPGSEAFPDVHGGDIETAVIAEYYPELVDLTLARSLPPVELKQEDVDKWLFSGSMKELSRDGYLGAPADYDAVDAQAVANDYAIRISDAIIKAFNL